MKRKLINLIFCLVLIFSCISCLSACGDEGDNQGNASGTGTNAAWHKGEGTPTLSIGAAGDYYFQTDNYDVWHYTDEGWRVIDNIKPASPAPDDGDTGTTPGGDSGTVPDTDTTPGGDTSTPPDTEEPKPDIYIGYMGYIFRDSTNTGILTELPKGEDCYEDTLSVYSTEMNKHFPGSYLNLTNSYVALMADYNAENATTVYSSTSVYRVSVYAKSDGTIKIGTAKVSDIVKAKNAGTAITPANVSSYSVTAGLNVIPLAVQLNIAPDETVVIGGAELYCNDNIPVNDEYGNYTLLDSVGSTQLIASGPAYKSTLAVAVNIVENSIYSDYPVNTKTVYASGSTVFNQTVSFGGAPYAYKNYKFFSGKTLSKIGIPVVKVGAIDENQTFTFHVINYDSTKTVQNSIAATHTIKLPMDQLGTNKDSVKKWIYVDISALNITLSDKQTLAFGKSGDTVQWGYGAINGGSDDFKFIKNSETFSAAAHSQGLFFDVYFRETDTLEEHIRQVKLENVIGNKNISILGDSISTFPEFSGGTASVNTNSTINGNFMWYSTSKAVYSANMTWWQQAINKSGMNLLVNNSWSGDQMKPHTENDGAKQFPGGIARADQLHDNTGDNSGTNPDIIAVFFGTNDRNRNESQANFKTMYKQMISKMQTAYPDADIFVFTLLHTNDVDVTLAEVEEYNKIIRDIALEMNLTLVDVCNESGITKDNYLSNTIDGVHPNAAGMDKITDTFVKALYEKYVK